MMAVDETPIPEEAAPPAEQDSLPRRAARGVVWAFAGGLGARVLDFVKVIVLARLLAPEDFGLFGIVMLAIVLVVTFTQTGFDMALIQKRGDARAYLDAAWTVLVIRGAALAALLFLGAPLVAMFFGEPRVVPLLRVMSGSVLLQGLVNIGVIYFQKDLEFHKELAYNMLTALVSLVVGIVLAYRLRSAWALVWAGLAGAFVRCVLSYVLHPYRPRPDLDTRRWSELFGFGKWILGNRLLWFCAMQGDDIVVGRFFGAAALGIYQVAFRIANLIATEVPEVLAVVAFPAYARLQDDMAQAKRHFLSAFVLTAAVILPMAGFIVVAAGALVEGLLGPHWLAAVPLVQLLAVAGLGRGMNATMGALLIGVGRPAEVTRVSAIVLIVLAAALVPLGWMWGLAGVCCAVAVMQWTGTVLLCRLVGRVVDLSWGELWRPAMHPLIGCVLAGAVALATSCLADTSVCKIAWCGSVGLAVYAAYLALACRYLGCPVLDVGMKFARLLQGA